MRIARSSLVSAVHRLAVLVALTFFAHGPTPALADRTIPVHLEPDHTRARALDAVHTVILGPGMEGRVREVQVRVPWSAIGFDSLAPPPAEGITGDLVTLRLNARALDPQVEGEVGEPEHLFLRLSRSRAPVEPVDSLRVEFHFPWVPSFPGAYPVRAIAAVEDSTGHISLYRGTGRLAVFPAIEVGGPMVVAPGESFPLRVRAIDQEGEPLPLEHAWEPAGGSMGTWSPLPRVLRAPDTEGLYRLHLRVPGRSDPDGHEIGGKSVLRVTRTADRARVWWGDLHGHSAASDGFGTPRRYFRYAQEEALLDFVALTDHDYLLTPDEWDSIGTLCDAADADPRFCALPAYEWSSRFGDRCVYLPRSDLPIHGRSNPDSDHPRELQAWARRNGAVLVPHHPATAFRSVDWTLHDPSAEPVCEVYSIHGLSLSDTSRNPWTPRTPVGQRWSTPRLVMAVPGRSYVAGHARDPALGIVAAGDIHSAQPGNLGLAAIVAPRLDRTALLDALRRRRVWGSTGVRAFVMLSVDGATWGDTAIAGSVVRVEGEIVAPTPIEEVALLRDDRPVLQTRPGRWWARLHWVEEPPAEGGTYRLVARLADGHRVWSSPQLVLPNRPLPALVRHRLVAADVSDSGGNAPHAFRAPDSAADSDPAPAPAPWRIELTIANRGVKPMAPGRMEAVLRPAGDAQPLAPILSIPHGGCPPRDTLRLVSRLDLPPGLHRLVLRSRTLQPQPDDDAPAVIGGEIAIFVPERPLVLRPDGVGAWRFDLREPTRVRVELVAAPRFFGVRERGPALEEERVGLELDGVPAGPPGESEILGRHALGRWRSQIVERNLPAGEHRLAARGEHAPDRVRVRAWAGGGESPMGASDRLDEGPAPKSDRSGGARPLGPDAPPDLLYGYEDGLTVSRHPVAPGIVALVITWSRDLSRISAFREERRWVELTIGLNRGRYVVRSVGLEPDRDWVWDDGRGTIRVVARADRPAAVGLLVRGWEVTAEMSARWGGEPAEEIWAGGRVWRRPGWIALPLTGEARPPLVRRREIAGFAPSRRARAEWLGHDSLLVPFPEDVAPLTARVRALSDPTRRVEAFRERMKAGRENPAFLRGAADALADAGRWGEAARLYARVRTDHGASTRWCVLEAECWNRAGDPERAVRLLRETLDEDRESERAHRALVRILIDRNPVAALAEVDWLEARAPGDPWVAYVRARAEWARKNTDAALQAIDRCLELNPDPNLRERAARLADRIRAARNGDP